MTDDLVTLEDVRAAEERIASFIQRTPIELSRAMSRMVGMRTLLKCEHLQRTGSFKIRGAANRITRLTDEEAARGVVCASAGNHAQGVALSARTAEVPATVFMPAEAPLPKVEATRGYGAEVVLTGENFDEALAAAKAFCAERGATFVPPFEDRDVIAGQGTLGLEVLDQVPDLGAVVVPIGGGGLISGVAVAIKAVRPDVRVIGVEAEGAASARASLDAGHVVTLDAVGTIADGIAVKRPGELTFAHIRELVDDVVTVSDEAIARSVLLLVERAKQVVEPAGAAALAALLAGQVAEPDGPVCVLLCGGNVDPLLLNRILQSGLYEEGRYLVITTRVGDRPGALATLLTLMADKRANVIGIEHHRLNTKLGVSEVEVVIELETRGLPHIATLVYELEKAGYPVEAELPPG